MSIIDRLNQYGDQYHTYAGTFYSVYNPENKKIYVTDGLGDAVINIDSAVNPVTKSIPVGDGPWNVAYNPANKKIYAVNILAETVSIIGSYSNKVLDTVKVGKNPWDIIYNPANKYVYVANREGGLYL